MKRTLALAFALTSLLGASAQADNQSLGAALGGALGGGFGALVGNELGGRGGAIVGGGLGAAAGAAVATQDNDDYDRRPVYRERHYRHSYRHEAPRGYFCPPGQAKKGRC